MSNKIISFYVILNKVFCGIGSGPGGQYKLNIFHGSFVERKKYEIPCNQ